MLRKVDHLLFRKIDIQSLALLRIVLGIWFFVDFAGMMLIGYVQEAYIDAQVHFPFYGFEWIKPLPATGMYMLFSLMSLASVCIIIGYRYKLATAFFMIGQLYVFMLDIPYTLNKFYLFILLSLVMLLLPANRHRSVDTLLNRVSAIKSIPAWNLLIFQFMIGLIYTYSGISKINPDWLTLHEPLTTFLTPKWPFQAFGDELRATVIAAMTYGGMFFDLIIVWLLIYRKTNWFGHLYQVSFHLLNFIYLGVGSLSIFMILLTLLLFPPSYLKRKLNIKSIQGSYPIKRPVKPFLAGFVLIMLLLPNRHYLIDNNVNWTEKGHRFSWRLMTRTKRGSSSTFLITDNHSGQVWQVNPGIYLTPRQYRKMSAETDLAIVFAHWLEKEWARKGFDDVRIQGLVNTRLNSRPPKLLFDPNLDLTKVKRTIWRDEISTLHER